MAHFYFRARQNNSRVQLVKVGSPSVTVNLEYSTDETNWSTWYNDTTLQSGQTLYLRGDNPDGYCYDVYVYWHFQTTSGTFEIGGDIRSLVDVTMGSSVVPVQMCFRKLFDGCTGLISADRQLISGFTTLTKQCYTEMFVGCTGLLNGVDMPSNVVLAEGCCHTMYDGCSSLTTAPELPATTLVYHCYAWMFRNCTSLTTAPDLPAINATSDNYIHMFAGCTSLNYIKCLAVSNSGYMQGWVDDVPSGGTFVKNVNMNNWTTGVNGIPTGWNVIDDATPSITVSQSSFTGLSYESVSTQRPYVTYVNIALSSVTATCAADWIDLDWVDSSTKAQLEIGVDDNETNLARTATVTITGRDYDNQSHSATITLQQVARPKGSITPDPATVNAYWNDDYDYYIDITYSGFSSIGTVNFSTGGSEDFISTLEWRDDETKTMLKIDCDRNTGTTSRTEYIYITGTDDWDNTVTATITVVQAAYKRFPIWKDVYYTGSTQTLDYYIVMDNDQTIYQGRAYVQPNQENVKINISKICQNYLNNDIEDGNEIINAIGVISHNYNAVRTFSLYNASGNTLLDEYTYFYNWSYKELDENLVLTTPINGHSDSRMVKVGTEVVLDQNEYENAIKGNLYTNGYCGNYALYYLQRNGGWAAFLIEGNSKKTDTYEKYSYNQAFNNNTAMFEKNTYHNQIVSSWELHTGWLNDEQSENLAFNLLSSNRVFLHDLKANKVIPVVLTNSEVEYKTFKNNGNHLINFTITAEESQRKQLI